MSKTKKEIDKELMYKKLMPSAPKGARMQADEPEENAAPAEELLGEARGEPGHRSKCPRKVSVPSMDSRSADVVNVMEGAVLGKLDDMLSRFRCCRCDRCKKDIVALALNKLPPKYRVVTDGRPELDPDPQMNAQVVAALIQAVIQVRKNPRH